MAMKMQPTGRRIRTRGLLAMILAFLVLAVALLYFRQEGVAQSTLPEIGLDSSTAFPVDI